MVRLSKDKERIKRKVLEEVLKRDNNPRKETFGIEDIFIIRDGIIVGKRTDKFEFTNTGITRKEVLKVRGS